MREEDLYMYSLSAQVGQESEKVKSSRQVTCRVECWTGQGSHLMCCQAEVIRPPVVWQPCGALVAYLGPGGIRTLVRGQIIRWSQEHFQ